MSTVSLVLVDGHHLLWRGACGFPARIRARDGEDRTACFAFFALLRVAQRDLPDTSEVIVCFDGQYGAAARQSDDAQYKSNRVDIDVTPIQALPDIKRGLDSVGLRWVELDDREGDDVIATLTARESDREVIVFSGDRDYFQLLDERVRVFNQAARAPRQPVGAGRAAGSGTAGGARSAPLEEVEKVSTTRFAERGVVWSVWRRDGLPSGRRRSSGDLEIRLADLG